MQELVFIIPPDLDGKPVRAAAMQGLHMSYGQFKRAKFTGEVLLNDAPARADVLVHAGQRLVIRVPDAPQSLPAAVDLHLTIPFEDEHLLVVDKPAPLPSSSSEKKGGVTLENGLFWHFSQPTDFVYRPVNRLDKGTSGLMVVAKTAHAQQLLQRQLHGEGFLREYLALVDGAPPLDAGLIDLPIGKADGATIRREILQAGKPAQTEYLVLQRFAHHALLRLRLHTGRTHQIRVHLAALGCPVTGDFLYGTERADVLPERFCLHSAFLTLRHPITGEWLKFESPAPAIFHALATQG